MQFTRDWESGWVTANTSYKSFSSAVVKADIGLHIGLAGVNVTLLGESDVPACSSGGHGHGRSPSALWMALLLLEASEPMSSLGCLCSWLAMPSLLGHSKTLVFLLWQETR